MPYIFYKSMVYSNIIFILQSICLFFVQSYSAVAEPEIKQGHMIHSLTKPSHLSQRNGGMALREASLAHFACMFIAPSE